MSESEDRVPWRKHMNSALNCAHISQHHEVLVACPACVSLALANHDADLRAKLEQATKALGHVRAILVNDGRAWRANAVGLLTEIEIVVVAALAPVNPGSETAPKTGSYEKRDSAEGRDA